MIQKIIYITGSADGGPTGRPPRARTDHAGCYVQPRRYACRLSGNTHTLTHTLTHTHTHTHTNTHKHTHIRYIYVFYIHTCVLCLASHT
jgi:hypothetical protein